MNTLLERWTQATETFGVPGALAVLVYAVALAGAVLAIGIAIGRAVRQWFRHRAVGRMLQQVHDEAYREHHGGGRAA